MLKYPPSKIYEFNCFKSVTSQFIHTTLRAVFNFAYGSLLIQHTLDLIEEYGIDNVPEEVMSELIYQMNSTSLELTEAIEELNQMKP